MCFQLYLGFRLASCIKQASKPELEIIARWKAPMKLFRHEAPCRDCSLFDGNFQRVSAKVNYKLPHLPFDDRNEVRSETSSMLIWYSLIFMRVRSRGPWVWVKKTFWRLRQKRDLDEDEKLKIVDSETDHASHSRLTQVLLWQSDR